MCYELYSFKLEVNLGQPIESTPVQLLHFLIQKAKLETVKLVCTQLTKTEIQKLILILYILQIYVIVYYNEKISYLSFRNRKLHFLTNIHITSF